MLSLMRMGSAPLYRGAEGDPITRGFKEDKEGYEKFY